MREWMVNHALWYQLRVVYEANDTWPYEGEIPFLEWFSFPPDWSHRWQDKSSYIISKIVTHSGSWVGRRVLGMGASYNEYDVRKWSEDQPSEIVGIQEL